MTLMDINYIFKDEMKTAVQKKINKDNLILD
jgi:hypothetical protein